jgi:hypothetical protein
MTTPVEQEGNGKLPQFRWIERYPSRTVEGLGMRCEIKYPLEYRLLYGLPPAQE